MIARFDRDGLVIATDDGGQRCVPYIAGEMHYWRVPRSSWSACLDQLRTLGIEIVTVPVPWSVHDRGAGVSYDFTGSRDLIGFLQEIHRAGLLCVVNPGPVVGAELTGLGVPERVLQNDQVRAITATGTPAWLPVPPRMMPVPSYASRAFQREASAWLEACAQHIADHRVPGGPLAALTITDATELLARSGPFDVDYHPDAIAWWHEFAGEREPPRAWSAEQTSACLEWTAFHEHYRSRTWSWIHDALDRGGLSDLPRIHGGAGTEPFQALIAPAQAALAGPAGLSFHHRRSEYRRIRRRALYLTGSAAPVPIATSVGVGQAPWLPPVDTSDSIAVIGQLAATGVRGLSLHMATLRDRWYGAPITGQGQTSQAAGAIGEMLAALRSSGWLRLRRHANACIVMSRADARAARASSPAAPLPAVLTELFGLGPAGSSALSRDPDGALYARWLGTIEQALDQAAISYVIVDEHAPDSAWSGYPLIVLPTLGRIDRQALDRLHTLAAAGARIIVGPYKPDRDQLDRPLERPLPRRVGLMQPGSLTDPAGLARDLRSALGPDDRGITASAEDSGPVHLDQFVDDTGALCGLGLGNPSPRRRTVTLAIDRPSTLCDLVTGEIVAKDASTARLTCDATSVRLLTVKPT